MERALPTRDDLRAEAQAFANTLSPSDRATLVTLSGELGAGKTAFVQAVAEALGVTDLVQSPTFVLEKIYLLTGTSYKRLVHIDAYRLAGGADLTALGFSELMADPGNLIMLEWPERIADALPPAEVAIRLAVAGEGRTISYDQE